MPKPLDRARERGLYCCSGFECVSWLVKISKSGPFDKLPDLYIYVAPLHLLILLAEDPSKHDTLPMRLTMPR